MVEVTDFTCCMPEPSPNCPPAPLNMLPLVRFTHGERSLAQSLRLGCSCVARRRGGVTAWHPVGSAEPGERPLFPTAVQGGRRHLPAARLQEQSASEQLSLPASLCWELQVSSRLRGCGSGAPRPRLGAAGSPGTAGVVTAGCVRTHQEPCQRRERSSILRDPCPCPAVSSAPWAHKPRRKERARRRAAPCLLQGQGALQQPQCLGTELCLLQTLQTAGDGETVVLSAETCVCPKEEKEEEGHFPGV